MPVVLDAGLARVVVRAVTAVDALAVVVHPACTLPHEVASDVVGEGQALLGVLAPCTLLLPVGAVSACGAPAKFHKYIFFYHRTLAELNICAIGTNCGKK